MVECRESSHSKHMPMIEDTLDFVEVLRFGGKSLNVGTTEIRHQLGTKKGFSVRTKKAPQVKPDNVRRLKIATSDGMNIKKFISKVGHCKKSHL